MKFFKPNLGGSFWGLFCYGGRVLYNIWRLGWVSDTKFGSNVSNEKLLNAANSQVYSFYYFWVIKGQPRDGVKIPFSPGRLALKCSEILHRVGVGNANSQYK